MSAFSRILAILTASSSCSSPMIALACTVTHTMQPKWMASWPITEMKRAGWNTEVSGLTWLSFSMGVAKLKAKEATVRQMPVEMSCSSLLRDPCMCITARQNAEIMQLSIMICCCWTVLTSVQRPWRTMSRTELMDGILEVNGAAIDASPSLTIGIMSADSSRAARPSSGFLCLGAFFMSSTWCSRSSLLMSIITCLMAPMLAIIPVWPNWARRFISASSRCGWLDISSFFFLAMPSVKRFLCTAALAAISFWLALSFSSGLRSSFGLSLPSPCSSELLSAFMLPKPLSSARPTSACFRAPTSLPPSPHIRVVNPRSLSALMTSALPSGDMRANTVMQSICVQSNGSWATAAARLSPDTLRSYFSARSGTVLALKVNSVLKAA
mmetsp:Transcript_26760/g.67323  ORF Transcript_26760/g.67323 Transcript_26760/m.67323 type:complete len:383 (-) Transcript_26760:2565-3713(-)